jgi:hypothetical protein
MSEVRRNLIWGLALALLFCASIVYSLSQRVEDVRETPIAIEQPGWHYYPLALLETAGPPPPVYVLWLRPGDMLAFLKYPELQILTLTYGADVELLDGTLEVVGTECTYSTSTGADISDNSRLGFVQNTRCNPLRGVPTGDLKLVVRLAERHRIGVGALVPIAPEADQGPDSIRVIGAPGGGQGMFPVLRGSYVEHLPPTYTRRIDLLAYMWRIQPASWIWQIVGLACVLWLMGAAIIPFRRLMVDHGRWGLALRASFGAGCSAAALGVIYAVIVPPFQGPDEPSHVLGYAQLMNRPDITDDARRWSQLIHFDRLQFHQEERFRPSDMTEPSRTPWEQPPTDNVLSRSSGNRLWLGLGPRLRHLSPSHTLLALRFFNVLVFAGALAIGIAILVWLTDVPFPQFAAFTFLFVPALPFFATIVSNYAWLTSAYVLFSIGVLAIVLGGRRGHYAGLVLGVATALILSLSRSAFPMLAMLAVILGGRILIGEHGVLAPGVVARRALIFWGGLSVGLAMASLLMDPLYKAYLASMAVSYSAEVGQAYAWWTRHLPLVFGLGTAAAMAAEVGLAQLRRLIAQRAQPILPAFTRMAGAAAVLSVSGVMITSLFVSFPTLRNVDSKSPPEVAEYLKETVLAALGMFRLQRPDFMTSTSFWVGFGWLDTIPPDWLTVTLTTLTALALMALLVWFALHHSIRGLAWLATIGVGWLLTLTLYAITVLTYSPPLHGRYLIGLYLSVLPVCWSVLMLEHSRDWRPAVVQWSLFFGVSMAVHAYSLSFILRRYF